LQVTLKKFYARQTLFEQKQTALTELQQICRGGYLNFYLKIGSYFLNY